MTEAQSDSRAAMARQIFSRLSDFLKSPAVKLVAVCVIGLLLTIPLGLVWLISWERDENSTSVIREIGRQWGVAQSLAGPFAVVPYRVELMGTKMVEVVAGTAEKPVVVRREEPDITQAVRYAVFAPEMLTIDGDVETEIRQRSIYKATVYTADLALTGRFAPINTIASGDKVIGIDWDKMQMAVGISGLAGIETSELTLDSGDGILLEPGSGLMSGLGAGTIHAPALPDGAAKAAEGFSFRLALRLRGSDGLSFAPAGRTTEVSLRSPWPHPGFSGRFLPKDREIGGDGFTARWLVPHLARPLPSQWTLSDERVSGLKSFDFGVRFVTPVDFYSLVDRALKYGLMFVGIVFMIVFALEIATGVRVHGVQYLLVGIMIIMFFLLLLAFAEHVGFARAYLIAALATGGVLTAYVGLVFGGVRRALATLISFTLLYSVLYLILQLEDYALLAGASLGFVTLTGILFGTRRLDWSAVRSNAVKPVSGAPVAQAEG